MKILNINGQDAIARAISDFYTSEGGAPVNAELRDVTADNANPEEAGRVIESEVEKIKEFCILLGKDHSVTYPAFKSFAKKNIGAGIVVLDAHPGLQNYDKPLTGSNYLRALVNEKIVDSEKVIIVGSRNQGREERYFLEQKKLKCFTMKEISFEGVREICDAITSVARLWPRVYLSISLDVLDPAFAPATDHAEPGGLSTRELIYMIQRMKLMRNIAMADIVDFSPEKDALGLTAKAAAKLIVELG